MGRLIMPLILINYELLLKRTFIILILILFESTVFGQAYKITYEAKYKYDTLKLEKVTSEKILLYVNKNYNSVSGPEILFRKDSILTLVHDGKITQNEYLDQRSRFTYKGSLGFLVKKDHLLKEQIVFESVYTNYYSHVSPIELNWILEKDTSTKFGYSCKKAKLNYKGRQYIAWYTTEINIQDGPLFFSSLPGLILELYDTKNHYYFKFIGLSSLGKVSTPQLKFYNRKVIKASRNQVFELREFYRKDILNFTKVHHGIKITNPDDIQLIKEKSKHRNNPIELK